jgi:hypothetical protein
MSKKSLIANSCGQLGNTKKIVILMEHNLQM